MLKSMTGFGTSNIVKNSYEVTVEIKALNSKYADISIRMPSQLSILELHLRKEITTALNRGKINVSIEVTNTAQDPSTLLDQELLKKYYSQFKKESDDLSAQVSDLFSLALHAPGVLKTNEELVDEDLVDTITKAVGEAADKCNNFRSQEGLELQAKLSEYINSIRSLLSKIDEFENERIKKVEEKIKSTLASSKIVTDFDENRFEQELIYYIEKLDINEEKVRLANHLAYFDEVMNGQESNGKKLGFIAQEIGREINTIGSKANNASIQRLVVEMKEELEKIKEQALNVL